MAVGSPIQSQVHALDLDSSFGNSNLCLRCYAYPQPVGINTCTPRHSSVSAFVLGRELRLEFWESDVTCAAMRASTNPEGQYHPAKRWFWAAALSASVCVLWFSYVNRDGCWLNLRGLRTALTFFLFPWLWLLLLLGFKTKGRMILIAFTIVGALLWPTVDTSYVAAAESNAVGRLLQLQAALEIYKVEHKEQGYPQNLPNLTSSYPVEKTYRFVYVPSRSDGTITSYLIQATPLCRTCGCTRSFTITDGGTVYFTFEGRAATIYDHAL